MTVDRHFVGVPIGRGVDPKLWPSSTFPTFSRLPRCQGPTKALSLRPCRCARTARKTCHAQLHILIKIQSPPPHSLNTRVLKKNEKITIFWLILRGIHKNCRRLIRTVWPPFFLRYCPQGTVAVAMGMVEASTLYGHDRVDCM